MCADLTYHARLNFCIPETDADLVYVANFPNPSVK